MKWENLRRSSNVHDRRGGGGRAIGGIGGIIVLLLALYLGIDPNTLLQTTQVLDRPAAEHTTTPGNDPQYDFVAHILGSTEDVWTQLYATQLSTTKQQRYTPPQLIVFADYTATACGSGESAMGPFYCPADNSVYIDFSFYRDLQTRFAAPGDFAQAYVIAHEVGHHVQNLMGTSAKVHRARRTLSEADYNALSVKLELQADCYAGLWAHHADAAQPLLEQGDIDEALTAAAAIGDDRLQKQTQGYVVPESFTHGTSAQRQQWFKTGLDSGALAACDTFD